MLTIKKPLELENQHYYHLHDQVPGNLSKKIQNRRLSSSDNDPFSEIYPLMDERDKIK